MILSPALALPAALIATGVPAGCADGGADYPSLASRPAERLADDPRPASPGSSPSPALPSPDLAARLAGLVEQARRANGEFAARRAAAEQAVTAARGAAAGSEGWARATQALSALESSRALTAHPLADLDRLDVDDRLQAARTGTGVAARPDAVAIGQARAAVEAMVAQEDAALAGLGGRLR